MGTFHLNPKMQMIVKKDLKEFYHIYLCGADTLISYKKSLVLFEEITKFGNILLEALDTFHLMK